MSIKLGRKEFPSNHSPDDFECFGPAATKDGEFAGTRIADLGCFNQDGIDSNKAYTAHVTKSKKTGKWFAYFEWGRTGAASPDFQFVQCSDEADRSMSPNSTARTTSAANGRPSRASRL